jgi:hypothetical protein
MDRPDPGQSGSPDRPVTPAGQPLSEFGKPSVLPAASSIPRDWPMGPVPVGNGHGGLCGSRWSGVVDGRIPGTNVLGQGPPPARPDHPAAPIFAVAAVPFPTAAATAASSPPGVPASRFRRRHSFGAIVAITHHEQSITLGRVLPFKVRCNVGSLLFAISPVRSSYEEARTPPDHRQRKTD